VAEKILNGTFDTDLTSWNNIGVQKFVWESGYAKAASVFTGPGPRPVILTQDFGVIGSVTSAALSVSIAWDVAGGNKAPGRVLFNAKITDPNGVTTVLSTSTKGVGDGSGSLCSSLDIAYYMAVAGTYTLRLEAVCSSSTDEDEYGVKEYGISYGYIDDVSLLVIERFTKVVLEAIGGGELGTRIGLDLGVEGAGLSETLEGTQGKFERNKFGLLETLHAIVGSNALEAAGLAESYATHVGKRRSVPMEGAGLEESLRARWKVGNVMMERDVLAQEDIWTDIVPADSTQWEII
jgi:hypothetical protein